MPIIVHSPHSGRPVKIRDQDVGRAIRDEEGRIFYAVPRTDGNGYYASLTRQGSAKDEERYAELIAKDTRAHDVAQQRLAEAAAVHDATGSPRGGPLRRAVLIVVLLAILAALGYVAAVVLDVDIPGLINRGGINLPVPQGPSLPEPVEPLQLPEQGPPQPSHADPIWRELQAAGSLFDNAEPLYSVDEVAPPEAGSEKRAPASAEEPDPTATPEPASPPAPKLPPLTTTASGLQYRILQYAPESAPTATAGSYVLIHYTAKLPTGQVIDSSRNLPTPQAGSEERSDEGPDQNLDTSPAPIAFVLWSGQVIRGWDEGIAGMRVGEVRQLIVPPHLIHSPDSRLPSPSASTSGGEPAGSTHDFGLVFDIELIDALPGVLHSTTHAGTVGGRIATPGDTLAIHYRAYLHDAAPGTPAANAPFDDSRTRPGGQPFRLTLGARDAILGLELGLAGMKVGERRTIVIPPYLAYGRRGVGSLIPPDATLRYEVELVDIE